MMLRSKLRFAVPAAAMLAFVTGIGAQSPSRPLPAFTVVASDGHEVSSSTLTSEGQWVLVYVKPGAAATARLLTALGEWRFPSEQARRVVLVFEGPRDQAAAFVAAKWTAENGDLVWYADAGGEATAALAPTGAPALWGIRAGAIEWTLAGVLSIPAPYEPVVRAWIGAPPAVR